METTAYFSATLYVLMVFQLTFRSTKSIKLALAPHIKGLIWLLRILTCLR